MNSKPTLSETMGWEKLLQAVMAEEISLDCLTGAELITINEMMEQERRKNAELLGDLMQKLHGMEGDVPENEHFVQIEHEEA